MEHAALWDLLAETTVLLRKGPEIISYDKGALVVHETFPMPYVDDVDGLEKVDLHFIIVGVDKAKAEANRAELVRLLKASPDLRPEFLGGPSYITIGAMIGDQEAALRLFALGHVLELWSVVTPASIGVHGESADMLAGSGFVYCTGYDG